MAVRAGGGGNLPFTNWRIQGVGGSPRRTRPGEIPDKGKHFFAKHAGAKWDGIYLGLKEKLST